MVDDEGVSLTWIVIMLAIVVGLFGWAFMAGSYVGAHTVIVDAESDLEEDDYNPVRRPNARRAFIHSMMVFFYHALTQLPNLPAVISWHFSHRIWLPILIFLVEAGVIAGGFGLKKLETNLAKPRHKRRRKR